MEYLWAFLAGGALCAIGQVLIDLTSMTPARILVTYVVSGVFLGAVGIYEPFAEFAGAGATVPLTGFGYLLSKGVKKAVTGEGLLGRSREGWKPAPEVSPPQLSSPLQPRLFSAGATRPRR